MPTPPDVQNDDQSEDNEPSTFRRWLPAIAGTASAIAAYGALRRWGKQRAEPALRVINRDPKNPTGPQMAAGHDDSLTSHLLYGGPTYNEHDASYRRTKLDTDDWRAAHPSGQIFAPTGDIPGEYLGGNPKHRGDVEGKLHEALRWNTLAPGFMPETHELRGDPQAPHRAAEALQAKLSPMGPVIVKGPSDIQTGSSLMTDADVPHLPTMATRIHADGYTTANGGHISRADLAQMNKVDGNAAARFRRSSDLTKVLHLEDYAAGNPLLVQKRLPIDHAGETRVHVLDGQVVRGTSRSRAADGSVANQLLGVADAGLSVLGLQRPALRRAEDFVQGHMDKLSPADRKEHAGWLAPDVAPIVGGGHVALETNPAGHSGFLVPTGESHLQTLGAAVNSHLLASHINGYNTRPLAAVRAGLVGTGVGALTALALKGLPSKEDEDEDTTNQSQGSGPRLPA